MTQKNNSCDSATLEEPKPVEGGARRPRIGIAGNNPDSDETRMLLTPEGCGMLCSGGFDICIESGAAIDISFTDADYTGFGVSVVSREEVLRSDIVLSFRPLPAKDIARMNPGGVMLCMMDTSLFEPEVIKALQTHRITAGCFDNMYSYNDEPVFANILDEIDGRGAIMYAQEALSYSGGGKGVLMAGVAGINPCEVLIIGDGSDVCAAAKAAMAVGASVTLMNNDISALQVAKQYCGDQLNCVAIHPKVLYNKVKTADVILLGTCTRTFEFPKNLSPALKDNVYILSFEETHPSISVPRTVAMALSNVLVNFFNELLIKGGFKEMVASTQGVQCGVVTYGGTLVDKLVGAYLGMPSVDISVLLATN